MAREIKFRGSKGDGTWYIGDFITDNREFNRTCDKAFILPRWDKLNCPISVDPKSVGQFTGLKDKNGREIYEGDIVEYNDCNSLRTGGHVEDKIIVGQVTFDCGMWLVEEVNSHHDLYEGLVNDEELEIIGNIYENPELLEVQGE